MKVVIQRFQKFPCILNRVFYDTYAIRADLKIGIRPVAYGPNLNYRASIYVREPRFKIRVDELLVVDK